MGPIDNDPKRRGVAKYVNLMMLAQQVHGQSLLAQTSSPNPEQDGAVTCSAAQEASTIQAGGAGHGSKPAKKGRDRFVQAEVRRRAERHVKDEQERVIAAARRSPNALVEPASVAGGRHQRIKG